MNQPFIFFWGGGGYVPPKKKLVIFLFGPTAQGEPGKSFLPTLASCLHKKDTLIRKTKFLWGLLKPNQKLPISYIFNKSFISFCLAQLNWQFCTGGIFQPSDLIRADGSKSSRLLISWSFVAGADGALPPGSSSTSTRASGGAPPPPSPGNLPGQAIDFKKKQCSDFMRSKKKRYKYIYIYYIT